MNKKPPSPLVWLLCQLITLYQHLVSPWLPRSCRFYPTCSSYCREALQHRGLWQGLGLGLWRILRCHPWHPGGYEPLSKEKEKTI